MKVEVGKSPPGMQLERVDRRVDLALEVGTLARAHLLDRKNVHAARLRRISNQARPSWDRSSRQPLPR